MNTEPQTATAFPEERLTESRAPLQSGTQSKTTKRRPRQEEALIERPLHDLEAEQSTLGAMLMELEAAQRARAILDASDFYRELHKKIFAASCAVMDAGKALDFVTVGSELKERGQDAETGSAVYLVSLMEACPNVANVEAYSQTVKQLAARRRALDTARALETLAKTGTAEDYLRALASAAEEEAREIAKARPRFALRSLSEVEEQLPKPAFIEGIAPQGSLFGLVGPFGSGKSFVAIDWALSAATGRDWCGRKVNGGAVVYITPEGTEAFGKRTRAWRINRGNASEGEPVECPGNFHLIAEAPLLMYPGDVEELLRAIQALPTAPALVVVDTVARHMVGGDENSQRDMGLFVAGADRIRAATGATLLLVHHTGKDGKMRGSTALPGALDAYAEVTKTGELSLTLSCGKAKDGAPFLPIGLVATVQELPERDTQTGRPLTSLVFGMDANGPKANPKAPLGSDAKKMLDLLPEEGASYSQWQKSAIAEGIAEGSFDRFKRLLLNGHAYQDAPSKRYFKAESHQPSNSHQTAITMQPLIPESPLPSSHHTPLGVMVDGDGDGSGESNEVAPTSKVKKSRRSKGDAAALSEPYGNTQNGS